MTFDLRLGDCISGMAEMPDKSVDVVLADPPYEAEAHTLQRRVRRGNEPLSFEPLSFEPVSEELRTASAAHMARLARRWILVFCQVEAAMKWRDALAAAGAVYRRACVWIKPDGMPQYSGDRPGMGYETIVACHAPGRSTWNGGGQHGVFVQNKYDADRSGHQTQKPGSLMEQLIRLFTDPGELVLDPFAGSGTTGVAAIRLGRRFIGWERDPKYHAVAMKRLSAAREQMRMPWAEGAPSFHAEAGSNQQGHKARTVGAVRMKPLSKPTKSSAGENPAGVAISQALPSCAPVRGQPSVTDGIDGAGEIPADGAISAVGADMKATPSGAGENPADGALVEPPPVPATCGVVGAQAKKLPRLAGGGQAGRRLTITDETGRPLL